jgi:hypothetical protein
MAIVVAGARLMTHTDARAKILKVAVRLATWILPPHRKDWAEAMLNEIAFIPSHGSALRWVLGCVLFTAKERASYELTAPVTTRRTVKLLFGLTGAFVIAVTGIYAMQKPYQRDRIALFVLYGCNKHGCPRH